MATIKELRSVALSLPESTEESHFERTSFRVRKKIFATYSEQDDRINLKLPLLTQQYFTATYPDVIYPVPNKWGEKGWTSVELRRVELSALTELLTTAYIAVAPKKLAKLLDNR